MISSAAIGSPAFNVTINFDTVPNGMTANSFAPGSGVSATSQLTTQFDNFGATFSTLSPGEPFAALVNLGPTEADSTPNGVAPVSNNSTIDYSYTLDIFIVDPVSFVAAVTDAIRIEGDIDPDGTTVTFSAFDINGNLLQTNTAADTAGAFYEIDSAVLGTPTIHEFRITSQDGTVAYDNLEFDTPSDIGATPEPGTWVLVSAGMFAIVMRRLLRPFGR